MNSQTVIKFVGLPALAISATMGCTTYQSNVPSINDLLMAETEQDGKACIRQADINGYGVLDDYSITVDARGKKHYIVTTMYRCSTLNTGFQAGFDGDNFDFCPIRDKIITIDQACPVKAIYEFESRQEAFDAYEKVKDIRQTLKSEMKDLQQSDQ